MKIQQLEPAGCDGRAGKGDLVAEEKIDGHRGLLHFGRELDRGYLSGRRISKKTGLLTEKGENVPSITQVVQKWSEFAGMGYTVLDGELVILGEPFESVQSVMGGHPETAARWLEENETKPTYFAFDVLIYNGQDMREIPWDARQLLLDRVMHEIQQTDAQHVQRVLQGEPDALYEQIVAAGGEGVVLKDPKAPYGRGWTKRKKALTFDVVITGFSEGAGKYEGLIGAVKFGIWDGMEVKEIGQCSGMIDGHSCWYSDLTQAFCSPNEPGSRIIPATLPTEQPEGSRLWFTQNKLGLIGQVMEVKSNGITRHGSLRHPQFQRMRQDKSVQQCKPATEQAQ